MANRHLSRSIVLQTLFEWDFLLSAKPKPEDGGKEVTESNHEKIRESLRRNLKEFAPDLKDDNFIFSLIDRVLEKRSTVDEIITRAAPEWPIEKISVVDRNILRIGLTELLFSDHGEVPPKVAINEAIELAKTFGGENSSKFVNGVLGAVYKELGSPGKDHQKGLPKNSGNSNQKEVDRSTLPVSKKGGALIYAIDSTNEIVFALVHDVFGYWTISKGTIDQNEDEKTGTQREIKKELSLDIEIEDKLGENEYVASHPENGKSLKRVIYFLAKSEFKDLVLEETGGLTEARWFKIHEVADLHMYNDIVPIIMKAIEIISSKK
jgi:N utilization substance protein B